MAEESESFFIDNFLHLKEQQPYPWQRKLFLRFSAPSTEPWPEVVDLPTGAGKTSVLYVWLLALAWSIQTKTYTVPRRLAWIVNRRVVVDQVTSEVETLFKQIDASPSEFRHLLASVSHTRTPLAASTLRGQLADNGDWGRDPSTPAVSGYSGHDRQPSLVSRIPRRTLLPADARRIARRRHVDRQR
jgi:CRISPR-associated endonuclease/helicase Cas3